MASQEELDAVYMSMTRCFATLSRDTRNKCGALIVKDGRILSCGFNGTPSGFSNLCQDEQGRTYPWVLHAEANAIAKLAICPESAEGATLYSSLTPCLECAKLIIQTRIKRVVCDGRYRLPDGEELLRDGDVPCYLYQRHHEVVD